MASAGGCRAGADGARACRIAHTMLALFRSATQRSDERRATPWQTLMTDLFDALTSTTELELRSENRFVFAESTTQRWLVQ